MAELRTLGWSASVTVTDTTLWLPVTDERPLEQIAAEGTVKVLGANAPKDQLMMMERVIHDGTREARQRNSMRSGLLFWPDMTRFPPVANIDLFGYYQPNPDKPLTLDQDREAYGTPNEETMGPIETTEVELRIGPALRFHRRWARRKRFGSSVVREDIIYAVRPRQVPDSLVFIVSWVEPQFSAVLIKVADKMAQTLRIELHDDS
jgi:hypothetical protein